MKRLLVATAAFIGTLGNPFPAQCKPADPDAGGQKAYAEDRKTEELNRLLGDARAVSYACGCDVIPYLKAWMAIDQAMFSLYDDWADQALRSGTFSPQNPDLKALKQGVKTAKLEGLAKAGINADEAEMAERSSGTSGASYHLKGTNCDYWKDHPEEVSSVRQFVAAR
jgi:hypothetical protein